MGILTGTIGADGVDKFTPASTFIEVVEYDPKAKTMDITFRSGTKTRYIDVYPTTYLAFKMSPTHSAFYTRAIKKNLQSIQIVSGGIGTQKSEPLKKITRSQTLDTGLKHQQARQQKVIGTVARAINDAGI